MKNDEEIITDLYKKYWQYMIEKDVSGLKKLMSADYVLLHMTGVKQSAEDFLSELKNGTFNYYFAEHDEIVVTIKGNEGTLLGKSRVLAAVYGGNKHLWRLRGDFTLKKENGVWLLTSSRASTY